VQATVLENYGAIEPSPLALREAAEIPLRPHTRCFDLADANTTLQLLKADGIAGAGVLRIGAHNAQLHTALRE
jgi:hypothetical protein